MSASKKKTVKKNNTKKQDGSLLARKRASAILEVMSGTVTPTEASEALNISVPRYYLMETKALEGMVEACEPKPVGYAWTPEREIEALKKEYSKLERECARYKALARAAQRTVGYNGSKGKKKVSKKGKRTRKPTVRALTLAKRLKTGLKEDAVASDKKAAAV